MVFSSLLFLFRFLPIVLLFYYIVPGKGRNVVLLLMSLIFYAWGEQEYVLIMLFSTVVDYVHGILTDYFKQRNRDICARLAVFSSVIINLGILCYFKYADMIVRGINYLTDSEISIMGVALPIGVSFYTFQTMSYTIDVYRGKAKVRKNILSFATYVTMFPQLIAGPIVRYSTIEKELKHRKETESLFAEGIKRFITGLGKKVLLANNVGQLWSQVQGMDISSLPMVTAWIGILSYTFQIYFDFSGYSDMAIGLGKMFGFHFEENFQYPYTSKSITEFWRRWHISLSSWFKEYVYIPLGGNRQGVIKQIRNIVIVWFLTGLWHGANANFILWGLYYGILLLIEKFVLKPIYRKWCSKQIGGNRAFCYHLISMIRHFYAVILIMSGWVIFSFSSMCDIGGYFKAMLGMGAGQYALYNHQTIFLLYTNIILFVIAAAGATPIPAKLVRYGEGRIRNEMVKTILQNVFYMMVFLLSVAYIVDSTYNPFLYFRF